jgi:hypothetical protein
MNTKPNFSKTLLDEAVDHVERPKTIPTGSYIATVGQWETGESKQKKTPFVRFPLRFISALDDVDAEELEAAGGCSGKQARIDFYVTEDAIYRLDAFHEHCGEDLADEISRKAHNDNCMNAQVGVVVAHRYPLDADGKPQPDAQPFIDIARTFKA